MEARVVTRYVRISPRKLRLVANVVRGKNAQQALVELKYLRKKGAKILYKTLKSALANAENKGSFDIDALKIKELRVDEGPTWKRFLPRAQGRATMIRKRTSHITLTLSE